jgi:branched-chain amino acid aminotransferase
MKSDFIWIDGKFVPYEQATLHLISPTIHYGIGVFEGIRCYATERGPAIFRLRDHMLRFLESIHILGVREFQFTVDALQDAVQKTVLINGFEECYIRPLMYLEGPMGLNMDKSIPKVAIAAWEWGPYLGLEARETGIHLMVSSFTRLHPNISLTKAKITGNYVNSMLVKTLALRSGYDEAVILDHQGNVAECTGENLFMIRRGVLYTPPLATVLEGITRDSVMTLAEERGLAVEECTITRDQLYIADEVFITGTAAEIVGVHMIDYRPIGNGGVGTYTRLLLQDFLDTIHGKGVHSKDWLSYIQQTELALN